MSESTEHDSKRTVFTEAVKRRVVARAQTALVGGAPHLAYAVKLGIPESRVFCGYDVVDNEYFGRNVSKKRTEGRPKGLPERPFFLAASRFVPKKNLERLLNAYFKYRNTAGDHAWDLVLMGDGELATALRRQRSRLGLESAVYMPGFVQYSELPDFYAWAGAFIHASTTEQWGLVVNEAMASGLPVLVSNRCGCAPDLIQTGRNGETFNPYDERAITALMLKFSSDKCDREKMGQASQQIISRWTPETFADGLAQAVQTACGIKPPRLGLLDKLLLRSLIRL